MPVVETKGSASSQGFGEFAKSGGAANYIEDVFSTYLYTGNGSTQTITNGIDLSTKGGLVWLKARSSAYSHCLTDTVQGRSKQLSSNNTLAANTAASNDGITTFNADGFSLGGANTFYNTNVNAVTFASWTFREQAKFFDVVTYTGNGAARTISHNLGSAPGCVIIKCTSLGGTDWMVYHRSASDGYFYLNTTDAKMTAGAATFFGNGSTVVAPTSTTVSLGSGDGQINQTSATYVMYLFAHDAGGFGLTGSDNVISCGSFTTSGTAPNNATVNLGYEPQFLLYKISSSTGDWRIVDNMRGFTASGAATTSPQLRPNLSNAEQNTSFVQLTSTGFTTDTGVDAQTYIYIAIRRGPMKTPTSGTSVFTPVTYTGNNASTRTISGAGFAPDLGLGIGRSGGMAGQNTWYDRLRGKEKGLISSSTGSEYDASTGGEGTMTMSGMVVDYIYGRLNDGTTPYIMYFAQRAPSFMDVVCYTGTGSATTFSHNLGVVPELMIFKSRVGATNWFVYNSTVTALKYLILQSTSASLTNSTIFNNTAPTSSVFTLGTNANINGSGSNFVAYLFASCSGVSKVGSYTGTGTTKQIDCGFTGGARFVMIKRTDDVGDWYVWDSARGIVSGNDPYLLLNSTAVEVTNTDYVDTYSAGFEISSTAPAAINANGGTFIFLAIA